MDANEYNQKILNYFNQKDISFETSFERNPTHGGKSLLLKDKTDFRLFTIRADQSADNKKIRKILGSQKLRFATPEELLSVAGVVSGALPPFGRPLIEIDHYIDEQLLENEFIAFNAAIIGERVRLKMTDYLTLVNPTVCEFKKL